MSLVDRLRPADADAVSVSETAALCGLSRSFVYELIAAGRGPRVTKIGTRSVILRDDRLAWLRSFQAEAGASGG